MLFDFQLKLNDKFMCAELALKACLKDPTILWPVPITTDLITLPASQRGYIYNAVNPIFYTYFISKIHYLLLNHPTFVIFFVKTSVNVSGL